MASPAKTKPKILVRKKLRRSKYSNYYKYSNRNKNSFLTIIGSNSNGIYKKKDSLIKNIKLYSASVCFIQESRLTKPGQLKIPSFQVFEVNRKNRGGGSLLTAIHQSLNPIFISGGENDVAIFLP